MFGVRSPLYVTGAPTKLSASVHAPDHARLTLQYPRLLLSTRTCSMVPPSRRNSGLALLSGMATLFPGAMASRLRPLLDEVCAAATAGDSSSDGGGGKATLRQTQKAVQSVVPALKAHGAEAGVGAQFVVEVGGCRPSPFGIEQKCVDRG